MAQGEKLELVDLSLVMERLRSMDEKERKNFFVGFETLWCQFLCTVSLVSAFPRCVILVHGPHQCISDHEAYFGPYLGQLWGMPMHMPRGSTYLTNQDVVLGAEEKLEAAILEVDQVYKPELIAVLTTCATGIAGEDVEGMVQACRDRVKADLMYVKSEGFRGAYMGAEMKVITDAFVSQLMVEPAVKIKDSVNLLGLYKDTPTGSKFSKFPNDVDEYSRYINALGLKVHAVIWGGLDAYQSMKRAAEAQFNANTCITWGLPVAEEMEKRFGIPYGRHGQALGVEINRKWIMEVAQAFGKEELAEKFWQSEYAKIADDFKRTQDLCQGKVALVDGGRNTQASVARTLMHARFVQELGMEPIMFNLHPMEIWGKYWDVDYFLSEGVNPKTAWYPYPFMRGLSPLAIMKELNLEPSQVFYIHSDLFHYAQATGEPFDAQGTFDSSLLPKIMASSHLRRCRGGPNRTYGIRGTQTLLKEIALAMKGVRAGAKPTFEARLSAKW